MGALRLHRYCQGISLIIFSERMTPSKEEKLRAAPFVHLLLILREEKDEKIKAWKKLASLLFQFSNLTNRRFNGEK